MERSGIGDEGSVGCVVCMFRFTSLISIKTDWRYLMNGDRAPRGNQVFGGIERDPIDEGLDTFPPSLSPSFCLPPALDGAKQL